MQSFLPLLVLSSTKPYSFAQLNVGGKQVYINNILSLLVTTPTRAKTDGHGAYRILAGEYQHEVVSHQNDEYVREGKIHTNTIEGYFSHLKRMIGGTHIHVSKKYLQQYVNEHSFRYVYRKEEQLMFHRILGRCVA